VLSLLLLLYAIYPLTGATLEGVDASSLVPMDEEGNIIIKKPTISGKVSL
jgi:hypothetical protein